MKLRYRILPQGRGPEPTDAELARYRDGRRLLYNYQRARALMHRRPIYRDPKAFLALLLIVLLALFISETLEREPPPAAPPVEQQP
jgi:hypothetical protein